MPELNGYLVRFHNESGFVLVQANCMAELKYKLRLFVPDLYIKKIEEFEDFGMIINLQKQ